MNTGCRSPVAVLMLVLLLAAGCGDGAGRRPGVRGGTLVIAGPTDLDYANSLLTPEKYTQEVNRFLLFLPLVRFSPDLDYEPALAESWVLEGDTAVVFRLRPDVRWHDGVPTRARDVVFTFERARDERTGYPNAEYFTHWTGVEEIDSLTVRCRFAPHAEPLAGLPFLPIMPAHLLDSIPAERLREARFNKAPVGNGPFRFVEYRANDRWVFEANPDYPAALGGRPNIDRLVWRVIPEAAAQIMELRTGTVDVLLNPQAEQFSSLDSLPFLTGIVKPSRTYAIIGWNHRRPPLGDARVRRALSYAIDRAEMLNVLRAGYGELAVGPIGPYHWAYDSTLTPLPYAPDSARALLAQAGITDRDDDGRLELPDGRDFRIELKYPANSAINRNLAQLIHADLAAIGVQLEQVALEFNAMVQDFATPRRDFDAILLGWESDFRINLEGAFHSRMETGQFQFAGYSNPTVDSLIDQTTRALPRAEARPLFARLQRLMRDEQPWGFLYYYPDLTLVNDRVQGVRMDIRGSLLNLPDWWLAGGGAPAAAAAPGDSAGRDPAPGRAPAQ